MDDSLPAEIGLNLCSLSGNFYERGEERNTEKGKIYI